MIAIVRPSVLLVLALMTLFPTQDIEAEQCVKKIFNRYCLGGPESAIPDSADKTSDAGGVATYRILDAKKRIELTTHDGRISSVTRHETPGSWMNFSDWKAKLLRLYGRGEDIGHFPAYATSRSSRLNAINAGKGYAHMRWQNTRWSVSVIWNHRDYVALHYELNATSQTSADEGL